MAYNRDYLVEFETEDGRIKQLKGVDIKFKIDLPMSATLTQAEISICNLKRKDVEYLTTYTSKWLAIDQRKKIRLFAGYTDDAPLRLIFSGDIIQALPTAPPNIWLECLAMSGDYGSTQTFSESILVQTPVKTVFTQAAGWADMEYEWKSASEKNIKKFDFTGNFPKLVEALNDLGDIIVFEENGKLIAVDRDAPSRDGTIREISESTGMVGVPIIDYIGIEAKMFLDTRIRRGDTVHLTSVRVPIASGNYYVYNVKHEGHLRGEMWYTTIKARRLDTYGSELTS